MESQKKKTYHFTLLRRKEPYQRVDFILVALVCGFMCKQFGWQMADKENLLAVGCLILAVGTNGVLLLLNFWSVVAHEFYAYSSLPDNAIEKCTHVKAKVDNKKQNTTKQFIVPLIVQSVQLAEGRINRSNQVELQKKKFIYNQERKTFTQIPYPVKETIEFYQDYEGISDELSLKKADLVWGPNKMSIPIPDFVQLYKEHMVAPFFVFQLFTSALWLLDEYWYFTLMTLFMLFMFEGTVVFQRLQNFKRLRAMRVPA